MSAKRDDARSSARSRLNPNDIFRAHSNTSIEIRLVSKLHRLNRPPDIDYPIW